MIIVDANYLIAVSNIQDSLHARANLVKNRLQDAPILYLEDILKESQTAITVKINHKAGFDWINSVYDNESDEDRQYNLNSIEYFNVLNFWGDLKESKLSFVDAEIIYLAQKYNFQVLTFDQEIIKRLPKNLVFA